MKRANRDHLRSRVESAAEAALKAQGYVSAIDVLMGIGWLEPSVLKRWQLRQLPSLERGIQVNLPKISEAMKLFRAWAQEQQLEPSETAYVARTPARPALQFSQSGDATIERLYRTRWVSRELSEKKRERIEAKANRPPELVVIQPLNDDWRCHRCSGTGAC